MNRHRIARALRRSFIPLITLLVAGFTHAAEPARPAGPEAGSKAETARLAWNFTPDPALPNVLILGDSISIGYTLETRALLHGKANVFRPMDAKGNAAENCDGTTKGVKSIDRWLGERKWSVIHFNFGLHDLKHVTEPGGNVITKDPLAPAQATVDQYARNLEDIVRKLKATKARLIFATTTPVPAGEQNPFRDPEDPPRYNAAAIRIMDANGIHVNDLFALCQPRLAQLQLPHNVHFNAKGSSFLAAGVAKAIETELRVGQ